MLASKPLLRQDAPLTEEGWAQAQGAAKEIYTTLLTSFQPTGDRLVYSSPTSRTLSTAASLATELDIDQITPAFALNSCAAAQSHGVGHDCFSYANAEAKLGKVKLACWPPVGDPKQVNTLMTKTGQGGFCKLVADLAAKHKPGSLLFLVTHREGIWDLQRHVQVKTGPSRYCSVDYLAYDHDRKALTTWMSEAGGAEGRRKNGSFHDAQMAPKAAVRAGKVPRGLSTNTVVNSKLTEVLASGDGKIETVRSVKLWRTPGVRDLWVEGGETDSQEALDLLSSPQPSENGEGNFVLVRRASGVEGWIKVTDVVVPPSNSAA